MSETQAIQRSEQPTPLELIHRAVQSGAQVDVMEKLMGLQERWERNEARKAFDAAVAKAKAEIPIIRKGNLVDFTSAKGRTRYQYEDLASIAQIIDPILSKHGLSYRWRPNSDAKSVTVTCILSHAAGHLEESTLYAPHDLSGNKNPIQAVGSAVTYLQRYTLKAALGLAAAADDDARSVSPQSAPAPIVKSAESVQPQGELESVGQIISVVERHSKDGAPKKWTAYFIRFNSASGESEAATFDKRLADLAHTLSDTQETARITTGPGRKPGTRELLRLEPAEQPPAEEDEIPMDFDKKGQPLHEGTTT